MTRARRGREMMNSRLITLAVATLAATAMLAGSVASRSNAAPGSSVQASPTIPLLRVGLAVSVPTLDAAHSTSAGYVTSLALETLMKRNREGKLVPHLARSVSQPARSVYVYELRRGIKFSDGQELTASDVANSLNYNRYPTSKVAGLGYGNVRSVVAKGRYTVVVTLKHPDATWGDVSARWNTAIFQKKYADAHKGTYGQPGVLTVGTGPWKVVSLDPTKGVELAANANYWGGRVPIGRISIKFFSDESSMALAFRAGEIDAVPQVFDIRAWSATAGTKPATVRSCAASLVAMDTAGGPWRDIHVRRAVAYALNRKDFISALGGFGTPGATLITRSQLRSIASNAEIARLVKSLPSYSFNLRKARAELAKSAYPTGFNEDLVVPTFGVYVNQSQVLQAALRKIGINLNLKTVSAGEWIAYVLGPAGKKGINFAHIDCSSEDPSTYPTTFLGTKALKGFNLADYASPAVDNLLLAGLTTSDDGKRFATYSALLGLLARDVPYVPLYTEFASYAISSRFSWARGANWYSGVGPWALTIKRR